MMNRTMLILTSLLALIGPACALAPPFKNAGPSKSHEGVEVAVTRQRCDLSTEPGQYGWDLLETTLEVQVTNATAAPLTVHRDAIRLLTPNGAALKTQTWGSSEPLTIAGGATGTFELRFMNRGRMQCKSDMALDLDGGFTLPAGPVRVSALKFTPSRV
jgi:hypothetical protein